MLLRLLTVETQNNDLKGVLILKKHSREKLKKIIKKICKKSKSLLQYIIKSFILRKGYLMSPIWLVSTV